MQKGKVMRIARKVKLVTLAVCLMGTAPALSQTTPATEQQATQGDQNSVDASQAAAEAPVTFADIRADAIARLRTDAENGSTGIAYHLGRALLGDVTNPAAQEEGARFIEQAAEGGVVAAQVQYAGLLRTGGAGVAVDRARALDMLEDAVSTGDPSAMTVLGLFLLDFELGAEGLERALTLIEDAYELGDLDAATALGNLYMQGRGVPADLQKAAHYFEVGAAAGNTAAIVALGDIIRLGGLNLQANPERALAAYQEANLRGNQGAARKIADMYLRGEGVEPSVEKAEQLLLESTQKGDPTAYVALADLYLRGEFVAIDTQRGIEYLQKSIDAGNIAAWVRLGDVYRFGSRGLDADVDKAVEYYSKAADAGIASAQRALANVYLDLTLDITDPFLGIELLESAARSGDGAAALQLAQLYSANDMLQADYEQAKNYYDLAVNLGNVGAVVREGAAYLAGPLAIEHRKEGLSLLQAAVESRIPGAATELARLQLAGAIPGLGADGVIPMLLDAARAGDVSAARYLVQVYRDGIGLVLQPDRSAAEALLTEMEPLLGEEATAVERILITAREGVSPSLLQTINEAFAGLSRQSGVQVLRQLRAANARAYVYIVQDRLAARGIYTGPIHGTLDSRTIASMRQVCQMTDQLSQCASGPLTDPAVLVIANYIFDLRAPT